MKLFIHKGIIKLQGLSRRSWYPLLVAFFAFLDAFIAVIPNDVLLISAVLGRPRSWLAVSLCITLGSAIGATLLAELISNYGETLVSYFFSPAFLTSETWKNTVGFIHKRGALGLALISISPAPQHPGVAIVGLAHMPMRTIFTAVMIGRGIKYGFIAWATSHSPKLLRKLGLMIPRSETQ